MQLGGDLSRQQPICGQEQAQSYQERSKFLPATLVEAACAAARRRDSIFQPKFHRWMRRLGEAKANVALARSLLELAYVILKERQPYQEPDPKQMHELEKARLVRHHAKRLRQLGADNELMEEVVARLDRHDAPPAVEKKATTQLPLQAIRRASAAKVCRGALGFRALKQGSTNIRLSRSLPLKLIHRGHRESNVMSPPETNRPETQ